MKLNQLTYIVPAACAVLAFSSCSKKEDASTTTTTAKSADSGAKAKSSGGSSAIVGTWKDNDGAETITYKADGTMSEKLASGDVIAGTYSMADAGHIKVKFEGAMAAMGEQTFPVTINGDGMDMTGPTGASMNYNKVK